MIDSDGDAVIVQTTYKAPRGRVVRIPLSTPQEEHWTTVVPEHAEPLEEVSSGGGLLFARFLKDVTARVRVYRMDGTFDHEVVLPGPGMALALTDRAQLRRSSTRLPRCKSRRRSTATTSRGGPASRSKSLACQGTRPTRS